MADRDRDETYSEAETVARREATIKRMLATPHRPHKSDRRGREVARQKPEPEKPE